MGGQACVFYGAAEFSRDTDLVVLSEPSNLSLLQAALGDLDAHQIAVPPFEVRYLDMGLAIHFRCAAPEAANSRLDIMSRLRGVDPFERLWARRHTLQLGDVTIDLMALSDLVQAKKTQRDKDWPMLTRLIEANYAAHAANSSDAQLLFWFREMRTPELLIQLAAKYPDLCRRVQATRELLIFALTGDEAALRQGLRAEEDAEREADRQYWLPLKHELERLRREQRRKP